MSQGRNRVTVGRRVSYFPTDAEAATGNGDAGCTFPATITEINADGTVQLHVLEADGGFITKASVVIGTQKGQCSVVFGTAAAHA
jgi:hypothetical protein